MKAFYIFPALVIVAATAMSSVSAAHPSHYPLKFTCVGLIL